jgi:hypothetical protein
VLGALLEHLSGLDSAAVIDVAVRVLAPVRRLAGDRVTVLHLGAALEEELQALYLDLAGSRVPLSEADRGSLGLLAAHCASGPQPATIPVRENKAVINRVRVALGQSVTADTVTDVLRLACAMSDGDVSLQAPARLRSFSRHERRILLAALDAVVAGNRARLGDVAQYAERWKRLGERLHPHEHPRWPGALDVFAAARGQIRVPSAGSRVEAAMRSGDVAGAAALLAHAPGRLIRSADWLLRSGTSAADPAVAGVALPLSGKTVAAGLGMLPRGSVSPADGEWLRFFVYWRQKARRTDYDLSALMLDEAYADAEQVSWTNLRTGYAEYSGDLTEAEHGASEFINIHLAAVPRRFVIPQVHIYAGEGFDEAEEAFFGFMTRSAEQKGLPFEPRTVRMKSDLRGAGRIALPLVFMRGDDGKWRAKWLHLYLKGRPSFNQVEGGKITTALLTRAIVERDYLRVSYITDLMAAQAARVTAYKPGCVLGPGPVTFIGLEQPEELPAGSQVFTLNRLRDLVPA